MKKTIKRVLAVIGALLALAILGMVVKFFVLSPKMRPAPNVTASNTPEAIARGKYLALHVAGCVACHSPVQKAVPGEPPEDGKLAAGRDFGAWPGAPFHLRSHNLTPDKETGIGDWTDGEVIRAMREGIGKDGHALFPQMPYQTYAQTLSDEDSLAIVAYLRTLPAVKNDPGKTTVDFPVSMFIRAAPRPLEKSPPPPPPAADKLARGNWLLAVSSCNECHDSRDGKGQKLPGKTLAGGMKFTLPDGKGFVIAPNITSDKAVGIGSYSDEDLKRVFEDGKGKSGRFLYVMPWSYYKGMTPEDKDALIFALRQVPPNPQIVPASAIK